MGSIVIHNLIGNAYKSHKVIAYSHYDHKEKDHFWLCVCTSCGKEKAVRQKGLLYKNKGCRCQIGVKHGLHKSSEYQAYLGMKQRCCNPNFKHYELWGGRGIKVCDRWLESFDNFFSDMGFKPSDKHSLDRIEVNGNYTPENCRWATPIEQASNKRNTVLYEYNGENLTMYELARKYRLHTTTLQKRIKSGWSVPESIEVPVIKNQKYKQRKNEMV